MSWLRGYTNLIQGMISLAGTYTLTFFGIAGDKVQFPAVSHLKETGAVPISTNVRHLHFHSNASSYAGMTLMLITSPFKNQYPTQPRR